MNDFSDMLSKAKKVQDKMKEVQENLKKVEVEGVSGGGMVKVVATAKGEVKRIILDESLLKPEDKEIKEALDKELVTELSMFILNDAHIYKRRILPVIKNMKRKII